MAIALAKLLSSNPAIAIAKLESIDENPNLGYGLTIGRYAQMIETVRSSIESLFAER